MSQWYVFLQRTITEDWAVWTGKVSDMLAEGTDDLMIFKPTGKGGYYLDAYSEAKMRSERLGFPLREVPQPR